MSEMWEHGPDEEPVEDCDCRRCAVAFRDRYKAALAAKEREFEIGCEPLDGKWYWVEGEGFNEGLAAPAMYRANVDCFYSYEFTGVPRRHVKVLRAA